MAVDVDGRFIIAVECSAQRSDLADIFQRHARTEEIGRNIFVFLIILIQQHRRHIAAHIRKFSSLCPERAGCFLPCAVIKYAQRPCVQRASGCRISVVIQIFPAGSLIDHDRRILRFFRVLHFCMDRRKWLCVHQHASASQDHGK